MAFSRNVSPTFTEWSLFFWELNVDFKNAFAHDKIESCIKFDEVFMEILNRQAPLKKKILRANHSSYMSKKLRAAILGSYLEKKYFKKRTNQSIRAYKSHCSRLYKKQRKRFFTGVNPSFLTDNKLFWKTVMPFFSDKGNYCLELILNWFKMTVKAPKVKWVL